MVLYSQNKLRLVHDHTGANATSDANTNTRNEKFAFELKLAFFRGNQLKSKVMQLLHICMLLEHSIISIDL